MHRRQFLHTIGGAAAATASRSAAAARKPNIVVIMADDMGYSDIGCYGGEISTPNIDSLARSGVRFTQFYNNAKCCPTRSALLTGLYNHQTGVGNMINNQGAPSYQGFLNDRCVTIAEALKESGYATLMAGKWHVGEDRPHWPKDRGFDRYFGLISGSSSYYRVTEERPLVIEDKVYRPKDDTFYLTDLFTDYAVRYVDEYARRDQPFFLYTAFTSPHWPLHAPPEDVKKYRGKYLGGWDELRKRRHARQLEMGIMDRRWPLTPRDPEAPAWDSVRNKDAFDLKMAVYAAQIDRMDQNIGRILRKLRETGQEENTLVLFLADNGGCSVEVDRGKEGVPPGGPDSFLSYGLPWANASNTPFRLFKSWVHEGGISTPLIARWPSRIRQTGGLNRAPGHIMDIMPTCLDVAGASYPKTHKGRSILPVEGRSLLPLLDGKTREPHPTLCWEHIGNRAIRQGNWKLVSRKPDAWELYDLESDRTELNNLAAKNPAKVKEMDAAYRAWAHKCGVLTLEELKKLRPARG